MSEEQSTTSGSIERVAYDLMEIIQSHDEGSDKSDKGYWLKLYSQCLHTARGTDPDQILQRG